MSDLRARGFRAPLLEVRGISKRFGGHQALSDVSLSLVPGEVHAVAGENGAGKSTLMGILSGSIEPDGGTLLWEGRETALGDVGAAQALGIGMVHQEPQLVPALSVEENIGLGRLPSRRGVRVIDRRALREQAERALAPLSAGVRPEARVGSLGVAARQLVAIARALNRGARLIILDEPTSSLALAEIDSLFAALRELRGRGVALVYVSHRLEELRAIADLVTVLRDGRLVATAPIAEMTDDRIIEAMSGHPLFTEPSRRRGALPGETALAVRGLSRRGRLRDVTLEVRRGEIVGLAGLMGSGRSRVLRSIFGADRAEGEIEVRGEDGVLRPLASLAGAVERGVGLVPEDRRSMGLVMTASVADNVGLVTRAGARRFGFLLRGVLREAARRAVAALRIKTRGLEEPVRFLSGGNQQKVVLGRWLGADTRVLLLDEPTRGVDVAAKTEIHRHLRALADEGRALLVASSELPELLALCDRIHVMRQGRVVGELTRAAATPREILRLATGAQ